MTNQSENRELDRGDGPLRQLVWRQIAKLAEELVALVVKPRQQVVTMAATGYEIVLVDSPLSRWQMAFTGLPEHHQTVICGHTHMPFVRLVDRRLVINAGSIGMPYGRAGSWALLHDGGVSLRHTVVDVDAAVDAVVAGSTYPQRQAWADEYVGATNSDADAIAAFTQPGDRP